MCGHGVSIANLEVSKFDAPPNSLKDSNANPKVKIKEKKEVRVRFLVHNTSRVRGAC